MAGKPLKKLADQLWKNEGIIFMPKFDDNAVPGAIVFRRDWNDINTQANIKHHIDPALLPAVEGPRLCLLADFSRSHELAVDAAVELLRPQSGVTGSLKRATDVVAGFDSPVTYTMDLITLQNLVLDMPQEFWTKGLGRTLKADKKNRLVYQSIKSKLTFTFRDSGGTGIDLKSNGLGNLRTVGVNLNWKWRNEATLESKEELVVAVEYAYWDDERKVFRTDKR